MYNHFFFPFQFLLHFIQGVHVHVKEDKEYFMLLLEYIYEIFQMKIF